ncbi:hypothetical protein Tdes44962_MAKER10022, partial [Teratosphaeria destructans]
GAGEAGLVGRVGVGLVLEGVVVGVSAEAEEPVSPRALARADGCYVGGGGAMEESAAGLSEAELVDGFQVSGDGEPEFVRQGKGAHDIGRVDLFEGLILDRFWSPFLYGICLDRPVVLEIAGTRQVSPELHEEARRE